MYRVFWDAKAYQDLGEHLTFLKNVSPEAAKNLKRDVFSIAESLSLFPERFPEISAPTGIATTVRKCVIQKRYILLYGVEGESIFVLRLLDARKGFRFCL